VVRLLEEHFNRLIDYGFTAELEGVLDDIAGGRVQRQEVLSGFYFGSDAADDTGLKRLVSELGEIDAKGLATFPLGEGIDLRVGRYGPYVESGDGTRANVPDDLPPDELTLDKARELLANPAGEERVLGEHPETGRTVVAKTGATAPTSPSCCPTTHRRRRGPARRRCSSRWRWSRSRSDDAVRLLSIPRLVGADPETGDEITPSTAATGPT
jgi:DNA topoisomerase-1